MVITDVNQVVYLGDGATTAFPFTFRIIDATDIKLLLIDADGTETDITSDYFVDTVNSTVHYPGYAPGAEPPEADRPAPVQAGQKLVVYRELPVTQEKDLGEKWPFFVIELALDKLTMLIQQVKGIWDRCLKVSVGQEATAPDFNYTVPIEAGKTFRVKDDGTGFELTEDPAVAHAAAVAAQEAAERAQGAAEEARDDAETAADNAEDALDLIKEKATWFDNVATMKAAAGLQVGMLAGTKGYYSINDGGSSIYAIRAKTQEDVDDGGSIIFLDNGNVAELIKEEYISVKQFGAKGDGVSDDTISFANALTFANNKELSVPQGNYLITTPLLAENIEISDLGTYPQFKPAYINNIIPIPSVRNIGRMSQTVDVSEESMTSAQGMCYVESTDTIYMAVANQFTECYIYELDGTDFSIKDKHYYTSDLMHCNSLTYKPDTNELYAIRTSGLYTVLDASDMSVKRLGTLTEAIGALSYDKVTGFFVGFERFDNSSLPFSDTITYHILNANLEVVKTLNVKVSVLSNTFGNGCCANDGNIIIILSNSFVEVDYYGNLKRQLFIQQGVYSRNEIELEGMDVYKGSYLINNARWKVSASDKAESIDFYRAYSDIDAEYSLDAIIANTSSPYNYYGSDLNDYQNAGFYAVKNGTNFPDDITDAYLHVFVTGGTVGRGWLYQILHAMNTDKSERIYTRIRNSNGTWYNWLPVNQKEQTGSITANLGTLNSVSFAKKIGRTCEVYVNITELSGLFTTGTWNNLAVLPFTPFGEFDFWGMDSGHDEVISCKITAGGQLRVYPKRNDINTLRIHLTYMSKTI